jgi:hypothetical protein
MAGRPIYTTMLNIKINADSRYMFMFGRFFPCEEQACIDRHPFIIFNSYQLYIIK